MIFFTEKYLRGTIFFETAEPGGTTFAVSCSLALAPAW